MSITFKRILLLIGCCLLCNVLGSIPALFTMGEISNWYTTINKPSWQPPNWLFGPVWTLLFCLMGFSLYQILHSPNNKKALQLFVAQFVCNMLWTILFFKGHLIGWAFIEIIILWLLIIATIKATYTINKLGGYVLIPYLLWVTFAMVLNCTIWFLNK